MEPEELLAKGRWGIIKELAKGERSACEIAKKTGQSLANTTMILKLLEAHSIIKKAKLEADGTTRRKAGKPKTPYTLNQEMVVAAVIRPGLAEKISLRFKDLDDFQTLALNGFFTLEGKDLYCVLKLMGQTDMLKKADLIACLSSNEHELELFIITEHLNDVREKYSNTEVEGLNGKTKKIISWSHNKKEVEEGLERKEEYFINLVKNSRELLDKMGLLEELRKK